MPTLEPGVTGTHHARGRVAHRHLEPSPEQPADAATPVTMRERDSTRLEVDAITTHQRPGAGIDGDRMLEDDTATTGRGRRLGAQLEPQHVGALGPGPYGGRAAPPAGRVGREAHGLAPEGHRELAGGHIDHPVERGQGVRVDGPGRQPVLDQAQRVGHAVHTTRLPGRGEARTVAR